MFCLLRFVPLQQNAKAGAAVGHLHVFQRRLGGVAQLPGQIQTQARTSSVGGEKRLKNLCSFFKRYSTAVVNDIKGDFAMSANRADAQGDNNLLSAGVGVLERVFHEVSN